MTISYCVTACNETETLSKLLSYLVLVNTPEDEIIVLFDKDNYSSESEKIVLDYQKANNANNNFKVLYHPLNKNYAAFKNKCLEKSIKDFIFHIDADECPGVFLLGENLKSIIASNPEIELYRVSRMNNFIGVTEDDAKRWGWNIDNPNKWINWNTGDYQNRIFKRDYPNIKWIGKLHERVVGAKKYTDLPKEEDYALLHTKTIERQRATNERYMKLFTIDENMGRSTEC